MGTPGVADVWRPETLPADDNVNPYAYCVEVGAGRDWYFQRGRMIGYFGQMQFATLTAPPLRHMLGVAMSSPKYAGNWVGTNGYGKIVLGHHGYDVDGYDLEDANMTIRAASLLAFEGGLTLNESIVPGFMAVLGTGKVIAASNGEVQFVQPPVRVDPDALVGWADCPTPSVHHDRAYLERSLGIGVGRQILGLHGATGEERQYDFTGTGTVLIQSTEGSVA